MTQYLITDRRYRNAQSRYAIHVLDVVKQRIMKGEDPMDAIDVISQYVETDMAVHEAMECLETPIPRRSTTPPAKMLLAWSITTAAALIILTQIFK